MTTPPTRRRRSRLGSRRRTRPGDPPGILRPDPEADRPTLRVVAFGPGEAAEASLADVKELAAWVDRGAVLWVDVSGLGNAETIKQIGELFGLHALALEDVVGTHQRPKVEQYGQQLFLVMRMLHDNGGIDTEQISMFLGPRFVLTFQEYTDDDLEPVRERLRRGSGAIRERGADYLAYAIIDDVIDHYFPVLDRLGDRLETLEEAILRGGGPELVAHIRDIKRDLQTVRRAAWPMRDLLNAVLRDHSSSMSATMQPYLRDCADHTVQVMDLIETYREVANGLMDLHLSNVSYHTSEVMKVLTIIATIFIPLTFVVGVYGMNFNTDASPWNMPELNWPFGYPLVLGGMGLMTGGMLLYFRRRGWLSSAPPLAKSTPQRSRLRSD